MTKSRSFPSSQYDHDYNCTWLRVLATSDIHAHLRAYDYTRDRVVGDWGLARTASLIQTARKEMPASILLDNGDFLQGTPLADLYSTQAGNHPVVTAMNSLSYDAIGLGNHEFNYGLEVLHRAIEALNAPVICANVLTKKGESAEDDETLFTSSVLIERQLADPATGQMHPLCIGILSVLPPQLTRWDGASLSGRIETRDMVETAAAHVPALRQSGADIVVLLAHTGIDADADGYETENAALLLARLPGVDAIVAGHTHQVFPDLDASSSGEIDHAESTLNGVPAVMPGFRGSHLGVIDLCLTRNHSRWRIIGHQAEVRSVDDGTTLEHPGLVKNLQSGHDDTVRYMQTPLGQTSRPIHSYLSLARCDLPTRIVAAAKLMAVKEALDGGPYAQLPLLSASAPYQTGGRSGPLAYTDIAAGPLTMRNANDLYPFPNTLCAVLVTGAEIRDWLERAMSCFSQILPGRGDQCLLNPRSLGHAIDTIDGLRYRVDLTAPPAYDHSGRPTDPIKRHRRICDLTFDGIPVRSKDKFIVAANNYRVYGGGPYLPIPQERIILQSSRLVRDALACFLAEPGADSVSEDPAWSFLPVLGATVLIATGPGLAAHPDEIEKAGLQEAGYTPYGFMRMRMPLDRTACESAA